MTDKEYDKFTGALNKIKHGYKPNIFSNKYLKQVYTHKKKGYILKEFDNYLNIVNTEYPFESIEKKPIDLLKSKLKMIELFHEK